MAYRFEKEPNGEYALVIDGWENGIAKDPYSGLGLMTQVDLETPGEVAVGYPMTASSLSGGGNSIGNSIARSTRLFPTYVTRGTADGSEYGYAILDSNGRVWETPSPNGFTGTWTFLSSSNSTTNSSAQDGIAYWLGFLFKFRNDSIDYWNGTTWVAGWKTITGGVKHFAYVASNNQLYFTNGIFLGRIFAPVPSAFDPTSSSTYNFNAQILNLPATDVALSIVEVGGGNTAQSTLLVGGSLNAIYPWDKISTSFGLPIYVADSYIGRMVSANQNAFIFPGKFAGRGRIYITNGSQADLYYKVPDYIFGQQDPYYVWGDVIFHRNNLIFGFVVLSNARSGDVASNNIWALSLVNKAFRSLSTITTATGSLLPGALIPIISPVSPNGPSGFGYIAGWWDDSSAGGISYSNTTAGVSSSGTTINTDLMPVGTFTQKKTFTQLEYKLRTPLASGESISVVPIIDGSAGTAFTFQPTVAAGQLSGVANQTFQGAQWLSLQVTLVGNSGSSGGRLKELRLR